MPLNLNDLIKKAKDKGIKPSSVNEVSNGSFIRSWQQESVLFDPNASKTDNKLTTNRQQTDNKVVTNSKQNRQQSGNKKTKTDNKLTAQPATQLTTKRQQTDNKVATKSSFTSLVGLQRAIVLFIYNECKIARSKSTGNLTLEHINATLKTSCRCIKTTIQRLEKKGFIKRLSFKNGRGGWSKYAIPDPLFRELLQYETDNKLATNWQQTDNKVEAQLTTQPTTSASVVSSSYINTTTNGLPEKWENIEISFLEAIGFRESHLIQIYQAYQQTPENALTTNIVQESIDAFAFDLKHNADKLNLQKPLIAFISSLKKGRPWSSITPEHFVTPQQEAMNAYAKMKELQQQKTLALEQKIKELEFKEWQANLTEEKLISFSVKTEADFKGIPEGLHKTFRRRDAVTVTKDYFDAEIWPKKKDEIMGKITAEDKQAAMVENEE